MLAEEKTGIEGHMLTGQVALVTGACRGIGAAIALELSSLGATVVGWDRSVPSSSKPETGGVSLREVDVTDPTSVATAAAALVQAHGPVDILVNNAGIVGPTAPLTDYDDGEWDRVIAINLTSVHRLCKLFVPHMVKRGRGRIINMASTGGLRGMTNGSAYASSKGGVIAMTMSLAKEIAASGVTVNCVAPGPIDTELMSSLDASVVAEVTGKIAMRRMGRPQEVAATVGWIASPACSFTTGAVFDVSGGRLVS